MSNADRWETIGYKGSLRIYGRQCFDADFMPHDYCEIKEGVDGMVHRIDKGNLQDAWEEYNKEVDFTDED